MKLLRLRSIAIKTFKKEVDGQTKTITTFVASTDVEDRYSDIISQESWRLDAYKANPVVPIDHSYSVESVVGRAIELRVEDMVINGVARKALVVDIEWDMASEEGAAVAGKVERGFINAVSVGFRSHRQTWRAKMPKDHVAFGQDGYYLEENELYEISVVAVPANPEALAQRAARSAPDVTDIVSKTLEQLASDDALWAKIEARRLAAKASTTPEPAPAPTDPNTPYWLR